MKRNIRKIGTLPPLQQDTAMIVPNSFIKGGNFTTTDVVGDKLSTAISIERTSDLISVFDLSLRIMVTASNKITITNTDTGYITAEKDASSSDVVLTEFQGLKIIISSGLKNAVANDICDVCIYGDSTYIVPGTILGRIKDENNMYYGKWEPVGSDDSLYDIFRVCGGTIETNKDNFVSPVSDTINADDRYTVSVYVFGQVFEDVCRDINLTDTLKNKIQGIVWE